MTQIINDRPASSKAAKSLGRLELLAWLNELVEADYSKIEACSDGVGYCQVLDAVLPHFNMPLQKLNFNARTQDDNTRNLKLFVQYVKKAKIPFLIDVPKMATSRFQFNMECVQILYDFQHKHSPKASLFYNGFERRMEAYKRQLGLPIEAELASNKAIQMSTHLIPNKAFCRTKPLLPPQQV